MGSFFYFLGPPKNTVYRLPLEAAENLTYDAVRLADGNLFLLICRGRSQPLVEQIAPIDSPPTVNGRRRRKPQIWTPTSIASLRNTEEFAFQGNWQRWFTRWGELLRAMAYINRELAIALPEGEYQRLAEGGFEELRQLAPEDLRHRLSLLEHYAEIGCKPALVLKQCGY